MIGMNEVKMIVVLVAFFVLTSVSLFESWRYLNLATRCPSACSLVTIILMFFVAGSHAVSLVVHATEMKTYILNYNGHTDAGLMIIEQQTEQPT